MSRPVDMSPPAIEARLRRLSALSRLDLRSAPRVDMTPSGIEARLRECAEMSALCRSLAGGVGRR